MPTSGIDALSLAAHGSRAAASALRWAAANVFAWAGLLALAVAAASLERTGGDAPRAAPASAYLDFDLAVLREVTQRDLAGAAAGEHRALLALWSRRPDWTPPRSPAAQVRLVSLRDAWTAATAEKSRFRTAARGTADALPFLLGGLLLALLAAAAAGALAERTRDRASLRFAFAAGVFFLVAWPLSFMLRPAVFYDRTASPGTGLTAALFVAAFAGALSGAAARALFAPRPPARHLSALGRRPALFTAARLAALGATDWLAPMVPALAAAAVFVCAKADQDPSVVADKSGLGALIRAALREASAVERIGSAALVGGALLLLWYVGHRFVLEVRAALGAPA